MLSVIDVQHDAATSRGQEEEDTMSQKIAVLVSTALTVFVVIVAGALAVRLGSSMPEMAPSADSSQAAMEGSSNGVNPSTLELVQARDHQYRQQLDEVNTRLHQADERLRLLQAQQQALQSQNALLLARERTYQERLQEANRLLQQVAPSTAPGPKTPVGGLRQATYIDDADAVASRKAKKGQHSQEHERSPKQREHGEADDDD
jgi:hypothetical protein